MNNSNRNTAFVTEAALCLLIREHQTCPYHPRLSHGPVLVLNKRIPRRQALVLLSASGLFSEGVSGCHIAADPRYQARSEPPSSDLIRSAPRNVSYFSIPSVLETILEGAEILPLQITCTRGDVASVAQLMHDLPSKYTQPCRVPSRAVVGVPSGVDGEAETCLIP